MFDAEIEDFLKNKLKVKQFTREEKWRKDGALGAICYPFRLVSTHYCLFTSCWKDFGLHIVHQYQKRRNGKVYTIQQKVIDFEKDLSRIERILMPIVEYCREQKYSCVEKK